MSATKTAQVVQLPLLPNPREAEFLEKARASRRHGLLWLVLAVLQLIAGIVLLVWALATNQDGDTLVGYSAYGGTAVLFAGTITSIMFCTFASEDQARYEALAD